MISLRCNTILCSLHYNCYVMLIPRPHPPQTTYCTRFYNSQCTDDFLRWVWPRCEVSTHSFSFVLHTVAFSQQNFRSQNKYIAEPETEAGVKVKWAPPKSGAPRLHSTGRMGPPLGKWDPPWRMETRGPNYHLSNDIQVLCVCVRIYIYNNIYVVQGPINIF